MEHGRYPIRANFLFRFLANRLWAKLPRYCQFILSRTQSYFFELRWSRFLIKPYCLLQYDTGYNLGRFEPASGNSRYQSFQDFFTRKLVTNPKKKFDTAVWPCDGVLAESGQIDQLNLVEVKSQPKSVRNIFGKAAEIIPGSHYFANIFLHNRDYHRIHAPTAGRISRIEHIPGDLRFLRPWVYDKSPSLPALTNERYNVDIVDSQGQTWFLSIVGGPGVATIELDQNVAVGRSVVGGDHIAHFRLGSTCCLAMPTPSGLKIRTEIIFGTIIN